MAFWGLTLCTPVAADQQHFWEIRCLDLLNWKMSLRLTLKLLGWKWGLITEVSWKKDGKSEPQEEERQQTLVHRPTHMVKLEIQCFNLEDEGRIFFLSVYQHTSLHCAIIKTILWRTPALKIRKLIKLTKLLKADYIQNHTVIQKYSTVCPLVPYPLWDASIFINSSML